MSTGSRCYNCGRDNHQLRDCPYTLWCTNCEKKGHVLKYCRYQKSYRSTRPPKRGREDQNGPGSEGGVYFRVRCPRIQELESDTESTVFSQDLISRQLPPNYSPVANDSNHVAKHAAVTIPEARKELHFHGPGVYDIRTA